MIIQAAYIVAALLLTAATLWIAGYIWDRSLRSKIQGPRPISSKELEPTQDTLMTPPMGPEVLQLDHRWVSKTVADRMILDKPYDALMAQPGWRVWREQTERMDQEGMVWVEYVSPR